MSYSRLLKRYMTGDDVYELKQKLVDLGYLAKCTHNRYGNDTYRAVRSVQADKGLEVDGICGPLTWAAVFGDEPKPEPSPVVIPDHIGATAAKAIAADLQYVSETRQQVCLLALEWAIDPYNSPTAMRSFYVRGGNLYDRDLTPHLMTAARLKAYFAKSAYAPYYDGGRQEIMEAQAKASGYTIAGADCSGTVVGIWRKLRIKGPNFDASADGLYNSFCTEVTTPTAGDLCHRSGHIGIYVGGGYVVEDLGGAYGTQLTKRTNRKAYSFLDKKMHTMGKWANYGDPKCY